MSYLSKRSVILLLAALLGLAAPALASDVPEDHGAAIAQEAALDRLEAKADLVGEIPVIVQLRTDALPAIERLRGPGGDIQRAQRKLRDRARLIERAQNRLAAAIADRPARLARFRYLPLTALTADQEILRRLRSFPEVLSIHTPTCPPETPATDSRV